MGWEWCLRGAADGEAVTVSYPSQSSRRAQTGNHPLSVPPGIGREGKGCSLGPAQQEVRLAELGVEHVGMLV